jgi:hypothetical protein
MISFRAECGSEMQFCARAAPAIAASLALGLGFAPPALAQVAPPPTQDADPSKRIIVT